MIFEVPEKMCQTFLYYTHIVPRLQCMFQRWCLLNNKEKLYVDYEVLNSVETKGRSLYKALRDSFVQWDIIQDTEGACGFYPAALEQRHCPEIEQEITSVLNLFELTLHKLDNCKSVHSSDTLLSQKYSISDINSNDSEL